ncbi:MAG: helix-turn-helix domain-containing protein [Candidatus Thiothrix sulfatifontis]|nr:MAG: helix-turn-helix domain-containing protein [Candidatus Thiothrix sulfatifontis]
MDKRYKPLPVAEQVRQRVGLLEDIAMQPGMPLPQAVRALRTGIRLTVPEYAKLTGVAVRTIHEIEAGRANPSLLTANKLLLPFGLVLGVVKQQGNEHDG